ncbi:PCF11 [Candida oxycetoniae]|uniref:PCF11 n=1 Tax=Candida oxycetoniae TaxID=497107 RepID=A0AAI9T0F4_9ASCO|nr:PCF11 [Candida oxycetoniae]KAI3405730.2 PCF11 [Candida oxycetoniae]
MSALEHFEKELEHLSIKTSTLSHLAGLAVKYVDQANEIKDAIKRKLYISPPERKVWVMYFIHYLCVEVGNPYDLLFNAEIYDLFCHAYTSVGDQYLKPDKKMRTALQELKDMWYGEGGEKSRFDKTQLSRIDNFLVQAEALLRKDNLALSRGLNLTPEDLLIEGRKLLSYVVYLNQALDQLTFQEDHLTRNQKREIRRFEMIGNDCIDKINRTIDLIEQDIQPDPLSENPTTTFKASGLINFRDNASQYYVTLQEVRKLLDDQRRQQEEFVKKTRRQLAQIKIKMKKRDNKIEIRAKLDDFLQKFKVDIDPKPKKEFFIPMESSIDFESVVKNFGKEKVVVDSVFVNIEESDNKDFELLEIQQSKPLKKVEDVSPVEEVTNDVQSTAPTPKVDLLGLLGGTRSSSLFGASNENKPMSLLGSVSESSTTIAASTGNDEDKKIYSSNEEVISRQSKENLSPRLENNSYTQNPSSHEVEVSMADQTGTGGSEKQDNDSDKESGGVKELRLLSDSNKRIKGEAPPLSQQIVEAKKSQLGPALLDQVQQKESNTETDKEVSTIVGTKRKSGSNDIEFNTFNHGLAISTLGEGGDDEEDDSLTGAENDGPHKLATKPSLSFQEVETDDAVEDSTDVLPVRAPTPPHASHTIPGSERTSLSTPSAIAGDNAKSIDKLNFKKKMSFSDYKSRAQDNTKPSSPPTLPPAPPSSTHQVPLSDSSLEAIDSPALYNSSSPPPSRIPQTIADPPPSRIPQKVDPPLRSCLKRRDLRESSDVRQIKRVKFDD